MLTSPHSFGGYAVKILTASALVVVLATAIAVSLQAGTASADSKFAPTTAVRMCNALPAGFVDPQIAGSTSCVENLANSATADTSITLDLPGSSVNFATQVNFIPAGISIAAGGAITPGTKLGGVHTTEALSVNNADCSFVTTIDVVLFNVALPNSPTTPTNIVFPQAEGTIDRFAKWKVGSPPGGADPSGIDPGVDADHAAGTSLAFQNYPSYLLTMFAPATPVAVYGGLTRLNGEWQPLYLAQFAAGALLSAPAPFSMMSSGMGQPLVWVYGDPTATLPSPSSITGTCTPLNITTTLLGKDPSATFTRATSPMAAGTKFYMQYLASYRDTDQDGYENTIDTCPLNPDVGSPKTGGGDSDGDGIDDACDAAFTPVSADADADSFKNRQDNCPQIANATQVQVEASPAPDKGPKTDNIGDACDSEGGTIHIRQNCTPSVCTGATTNLSITMSDTVANGRFRVASNLAPKCFGSIDADGDGYCQAQDSGSDGSFGDPCLLAVPASCAVQHNGWSPSTNPCLVAGGVGGPGSLVDTDSDRINNALPFSDCAETYLGTDPTKPCAMTGETDFGSANDEGISAVSGGDGGDNFPLDFNDDQLVNGQDILKYGPIWGKAVNTTLSGPTAVYTSGRRWDLNFDGLIQGQDVLKFNSLFGKSCGEPGGPPLTNGGTFQQ
jgi:hypothetical protein